MAAEDYINFDFDSRDDQYGDDDFETFDVRRIVRTTQKAILFDIQGVEIWAPRRLVQCHGEGTACHSVTVGSWLRGEFQKKLAAAKKAKI